MARTSAPAESRRRTRNDPVNPVAPVTRTLLPERFVEVVELEVCMGLFSVSPLYRVSILVYKRSAFKE